MLSGKKLQEARLAAKMSIPDLAAAIVRPGLDADKARGAIGNWEREYQRPLPTRVDIEALGNALGVRRVDLVVWHACHKWAPIAPRKARLVTELISGRTVQDALDVLKFANKRAAVMVDKVLRSAIANADEQEASVEDLYVTEARVDEGGVRLGTKQWRAKDRGRAVAWIRLASHIHVTLDQE